MTLAIFDLDDTLINGDSAHIWSTFMVEKGLLDGEKFLAENDRLMAEYANGCLDMNEYMSYTLKSLKGLH